MTGVKNVDFDQIKEHGMDYYKNRIPLYEQIYDVARLVPYGKVATYGQIARIVGTCTARMVGYAMSALKPGQNVPWQRVINSKGEVSQHGDGIGTTLQRQLLEDEGVIFDQKGKVDFDRFGWHGPTWDLEDQNPQKGVNE